MHVIIQGPSPYWPRRASRLQSIFLHGFFQRSLCGILRLFQQLLRYVLMEAVGLWADPGHFEFEVAVLVVVMYEMRTEEGISLSILQARWGRSGMLTFEPLPSLPA